jgi:hypothetical protein
MDQYRDLGMREYLDRLAAEDKRGDAVAAMRGHDDEVTSFRLPDGASSTILRTAPAFGTRCLATAGPIAIPP